MQQYNSDILHTINYYDQEEDGVTGKEEEALDLLRGPWSREWKNLVYTKVEVYFHSGMGSKSHISEEFSKQKATWGQGCDFSGVEK